MALVTPADCLRPGRDGLGRAHHTLQAIPNPVLPPPPPRSRWGHPPSIPCSARNSLLRHRAGRASLNQQQSPGQSCSGAQPRAGSCDSPEAAASAVQQLGAVQRAQQRAWTHEGLESLMWGSGSPLSLMSWGPSRMAAVGHPAFHCSCKPRREAQENPEDARVFSTASLSWSITLMTAGTGPAPGPSRFPLRV